VSAAGPRIAIPVPHSSDREYAERALPQYEEAVRLAGGVPVPIPLDLSPAEVMHQLDQCDAVLLPGSGADINPEKYTASKHEKTAPADLRREAVDDLILRNAYSERKPVLGICYGLQALNVFRSGTLLQHIESRIRHNAGRTVANAHTVDLEPGSHLAAIVNSQTIPVNSSHHQSADGVGTGLRIVARSPLDGVIEALEGTLPGHFVLGVQWHPERSVKDHDEVSEPAKKIFLAFIQAARSQQAKRKNVERAP
jgi:putative glutamine amidotransferase